MSTYAIVYRPYPYLMHHGVQGQKWGVRKYQNADGSLTAEGYRHYYGSSRKDMTRDERSDWKTSMKADRNAWKANTKYNLKDLKKQVRQGTLDKESEEFQQAKQDRMLAKHGSKKNIDLYRYGSKADKEKAIKAAKAKKIGKTVTASVVGGSLGVATVGSIAGIATVGAIMVGNVIAGGALALMGAGTIGMAGIGLAGAKGTKAKMNNEVNNIEKLAYMKANQQTSPDGAITVFGAGGESQRMKVNMADRSKSKDELFKDLKMDLYKHADISDQMNRGKQVVTPYGNNPNWFINQYGKRTDSIIDALKSKGASQKEIDGYISEYSNLFGTKSRYRYRDRSGYGSYDNFNNEKFYSDSMNRAKYDPEYWKGWE